MKFVALFGKQSIYAFFKIIFIFKKLLKKLYDLYVKLSS